MKFYLTRRTSSVWRKFIIYINLLSQNSSPQPPFSFIITFASWFQFIFLRFTPTFAYTTDAPPQPTRPTAIHALRAYPGSGPLLGNCPDWWSLRTCTKTLHTSSTTCVVLPVNLLSSIEVYHYGIYKRLAQGVKFDLTRRTSSTCAQTRVWNACAFDGAVWSERKIPLSSFSGYVATWTV